jgi:predicted Zn finger-like uncharacterized protein
MIVECDRCYARYRYDEARFEGKPSKKLKCTKCLAVFEVYNTEAFERRPPVRPELGAEETISRRPGDGARAEITKKSKLPRLERSADELYLPENVKLSLAIIAGPQAGRIFPIDKARMVIGRQEADVPLEDPEVSRRHAAIEVAGDQMTLVDLGSTNGTFVGDEQVSEMPIENQGEFTIGGTTIMLIVTAPG